MTTKDRVLRLYEEYGSEFMDSLDLIEYRMALEEEFDVDIDANQNLESVEETAVVIEKLLAQ